MGHNTVFSRFRVDRDGAQIGHKLLLVQWQDGESELVVEDDQSPPATGARI